MVRVQAGLRSRMPPSLWISLFSLALLGMLSMGYQLGLSATRRTPAELLLALAFAGLLLIAAPLLAMTFQRVRRVCAAYSEERASSASGIGLRFGAFLGAAAFAVLLAGATTDRAALFQSELGLWQDAAAKSRTNERPHLRLAQLLKAEGRHEEAFAAVVTAQKINPFSSDVAFFARTYRVPEVLP